MHSHKICTFLKNHFQIALILVAFITINIITLSFYQNVLWDSSVYIGMGKYIYSSGKSGLWEPIRPLTLPIALGFLWKMGLDPLVYGKLLMLLFSVGTITLTYLISNKIFNRQAAIIASIIFSFSSLLIDVSHEILVEVPAVFFLLLGFYLYLSNRNIIAGFSFGMAFLTKFPAMIFLFAVAFSELLFLSQYKKTYQQKLKVILSILLAFAATILPYFIFNYLYYGSFLFPLESAKYVIGNVVSCTVSELKPAYYYIPLILKDNPLHIFFLSGLLFVLFSKRLRYDKNKLQIIIYIALFFLYFTLLACKTSRYPLLALPFISMISGHGLLSTFDKSIKKKKYQNMFVVLILILSFSLSVYYITSNSSQKKDVNSFIYFKDKNISGEILTTTPQIAVFTDLKLNPIYYSLYGSATADYFTDYINMHKDSIAYILINMNDIPCHPKDLECPTKTQNFIEFLKKNFNLEASFKTNNGDYFIFSPR